MADIQVSYPVIYPDFGPWKMMDKFMWIKIEIRNPPKQTAYGRAPVNAPIKGEGEYMMFLAPRTIGFNITHEWSNYENITSRFANVIANWTVNVGDLTGVASNVWKGLSFSNLAKGASSLFGGGGSKAGAEGINSLGSKITNALNTNVQNYRVDSSQVYKSSDFLTYIFDFDFNLGKGSGYMAQRLWNVIQNLMKISCPKDEQGISVSPPNIFKVTSYPSDWLHIEYAAIRTIQNDITDAQFHNGYPSNFKSTITFTDITPVFDTTFTLGTGAKVTTGVEG